MKRRTGSVRYLYGSSHSRAELAAMGALTPGRTGRIRLHEAGAYEDKLQQIGELIDPNGPVPAHRPDLGSCWIWQGPLTDDGYGPHRTVYEVLRFGATSGVVRRGNVLHHECRVKACVNPAHLTQMTNAEHGRLHAEEQHAVS